MKGARDPSLCSGHPRRGERQIGAGQSIMEYILLIGIVTVALTFMGPLFKRGLQSVVKVTADQIGDQRNADQDIVARDPDNPVEGISFLKSSSTNVASSVFKNVTTPGYGGLADVLVSENTDTNSESVTDLGYAPRQ